jgi:biotin carboxyl carrier protein
VAESRHSDNTTVKFELQVGDRVRTVEIQRRPDGYHVVVDGQPRIVDARHFASSSWSLLLHDNNGHASRSVEATVLPQKGTTGFDVYINGFEIPVQLKGGRGRRARDLGAQGAGNGPQRVSAPMPGKIVRILVNPGDSVKPRQGLVVIEAMKMENELRAARAGRVREVFVDEGQSVEAGASLVVVE